MSVNGRPSWFLAPDARTPSYATVPKNLTTTLFKLHYISVTKVNQLKLFWKIKAD
jgi:hypothetical protein